MNSFLDSDKENQNPNRIQISQRESIEKCPAQTQSPRGSPACEADFGSNTKIQRAKEKNNSDDEHYVPRNDTNITDEPAAADEGNDKEKDEAAVDEDLTRVEQQEQLDNQENNHQPVDDGANTDNLTEQDAPNPLDSEVLKYKDQINEALKSILRVYQQLSVESEKLGRILKDDLQLSREEALTSKALFLELYIPTFLELFPVGRALMTSLNIDYFKMKCVEEKQWPVESSVLEMKKNELRVKGLDKLRKRRHKIDYKDEVGLMVIFIGELEILNEKLLKLKNMQSVGNLNEADSATCKEEIESVGEEIDNLKNKFKNAKHYYIEAERKKFEKKIITQIYGPPPKDEGEEEVVDARNANARDNNHDDIIRGDSDGGVDSGSPDNGDNQSLDNDDSEDGNKKKRKAADENDDESEDGDEHGTYAVGVNDDYDWIEAETTKTWTKPNLLKTEFTLTRSDLGLPPVLFTPQTLHSLTVRDDCEALPTKLCVIVGVNDLYEQIARDISTKVHFLSKVDTIAFLVTTMDKKSKDANKDDVKTFSRMILTTLNGWQTSPLWKEKGHFIMTSDGADSLKKTVWVCTKAKQASKTEAAERQRYRTEMFEKAQTQSLIKKILGNQSDADGVGDGIPMSLESVIELFRMMDLGENDVVLEAGYGFYPRIPFLAALITKQPTIAFDPFAHDHFKRTVEGLYQNAKKKYLTWRHPELQQNTSEGATSSDKSGETTSRERPKRNRPVTAERPASKRQRGHSTSRDEEEVDESESDNDDASTKSDQSYKEEDVRDDESDDDDDEDDSDD